jgi:lantibiotic modifying enzyme
MSLHIKTDAHRIRRRQFLSGVAAGAAAGVAPSGAVAAPSFGMPAPIFEDPSDYKLAVKEAAAWIRSAEGKDQGGVWQPEPDRPDIKATVSPPDGFYSGSAGTVLFFLELAATGDKSYMDDARRGGDYLARSWRGSVASPSPVPGAQFSFYTGLAGTAFALAELWKATGDAGYRHEALQAADVLLKAAKPVGAGIAWMAWPGMTGNSGVVLVLLALADILGDAAGGHPFRTAAIRAGDRIVEQAIPDPRGGLRWQGMPPAFLGEPEGVYWPNLQLGTSGVAYALARLGAVTGEERFVKAAQAGALHLQRIATIRGDAALIHYREPDHTDLFYLGYCNGPAGTARLFYQLYLATKDPHYLEWTEMLARGVMASGIPDRQAPGFWNVVCQCCGSAGVVDFFLGMWAATGRDQYRAFAQRVGDQMLSRRTDFGGPGYRWYQAYTRVKPGEVTAETGYMIGAAGIGAALLHLDQAQSELYHRTVVMPDDPFPPINNN